MKLRTRLREPHFKLFVEPVELRAQLRFATRNQWFVDRRRVAKRTVNWLNGGNHLLFSIRSALPHRLKSIKEPRRNPARLIAVHSVMTLSRICEPLYFYSRALDGYRPVLFQRLLNFSECGNRIAEKFIEDNNGPRLSAS